MLPRNILPGFESTGIWPYNRDVFSEEDFAPAIATDRIFTPDNDIPPDSSISVSAITATVLEPGYVSPRDVYSIPKAQPRKSKGSSRKGKTQILTATPVREKLLCCKNKGRQKGCPKRRK